ncbi:MAG: hypothetical protein JXB49_08940 [Bacteroidales bacterium]|nr:hypothetical protein [Bacteroidales bacterium]
MDDLTNKFVQEAVVLLNGENDTSINVNRFQHLHLVEGLHQIIYNKLVYKKSYLRIGYYDGSESEPFPIQYIGDPPLFDRKMRPLRLSFNSGRHVELDSIADFYLLRNSQIAKLECSAEIEQEMYNQAMNLFEDKIFDKIWSIEVYHTGLEPLTIGFYRAVITTAIRRASAKNKKCVPIQPIVSWGDVHININYFLRKLSNNDFDRIITNLSDLSEKYSNFIVLKQSDETIDLKWILKRPMLSSEYDLLCANISNYATKNIITLLYERSQYNRKSIWAI